MLLHDKKIYDFESCSFHDNAIHGIYLPEDEGKEVSPLVFDIDHIVEWNECSEDGEVRFAVSQGVLSFYNVTDLDINIRWNKSNYTSSETGLYIIDIEKEEIETTLRLPKYFRWKIITNSSNYKFSFGASHANLNILGCHHLINRQYLLINERESILKKI